MTKDLVQQQFGAHAAAYATSTVHAKGASLGRLVELVKPQPHWQALDIATGAGHTAAAFAPHVARVVASDLTEEMLRRGCQARQGQGLRQHGDGARGRRGAARFRGAASTSSPAASPRITFPDVPTFVARGLARAEGGRHVRAGRQHLARCGIDSRLLRMPSCAMRRSPTTPSRRSATPATAAASAWPSGARCSPTPASRCSHKERLPKDMEFQPWAERMGCDRLPSSGCAPCCRTARRRCKAFLKPRDESGKLWFTLDEALILARKPA